MSGAIASGAQIDKQVTDNLAARQDRSIFFRPAELAVFDFRRSVQKLIRQETDDQQQGDFLEAHLAKTRSGKISAAVAAR